jgi:hypothetical protein
MLEAPLILLGGCPAGAVSLPLDGLNVVRTLSFQGSLDFRIQVVSWCQIGRVGRVLDRCDCFLRQKMLHVEGAVRRGVVQKQLAVCIEQVASYSMHVLVQTLWHQNNSGCWLWCPEECIPCGWFLWCRRQRSPSSWREISGVESSPTNPAG